MSANAALVRHPRDTRLYLFLGLANWFIFLDHVPNNMVSWITLRNFGFSGSVDLFVFIIGYNAALTYAPIMLERGGIVGATRVLRRAWQLYAAFIVLFAIYAVSIGDIATRYAAPDIIYEFNVAGLLDDPVRTVAHGLLLQSKALNLDLLQLSVLLMACFSDRAVADAARARLHAGRIGGALPSPRVSSNGRCRPFRTETGISTRSAGNYCLCSAPGARSAASAGFVPAFAAPVWGYLGLAYLVFAFAMTMAGRFPALGDMLPVVAA